MTTSKAKRRKLHAAINDLTATQVADIVRQQHPGVKGPRVDQIAKQLVAGAHRQVSPRRVQQRG